VPAIAFAVSRIWDTYWLSNHFQHRILGLGKVVFVPSPSSLATRLACITQFVPNGGRRLFDSLGKILSSPTNVFVQKFPFRATDFGWQIFSVPNLQYPKNKNGRRWRN